MDSPHPPLHPPPSQKEKNSPEPKPPSSPHPRSAISMTDNEEVGSKTCCSNISNFLKGMVFSAMIVYMCHFSGLFVVEVLPSKEGIVLLNELSYKSGTFEYSNSVTGNGASSVSLLWSTPLYKSRMHSLLNNSSLKTELKRSIGEQYISFKSDTPQSSVHSDSCSDKFAHEDKTRSRDTLNGNKASQTLNDAFFEKQQSAFESLSSTRLKDQLLVQFFTTDELGIASTFERELLTHVSMFMARIGQSSSWDEWMAQPLIQKKSKFIHCNNKLYECFRTLFST